MGGALRGSHHTWPCRLWRCKTTDSEEPMQQKGVWQEQRRGLQERNEHRRPSLLFCLLFLLSHFGTHLFLTLSEETHERCLLKERERKKTLPLPHRCVVIFRDTPARLVQPANLVPTAPRSPTSKKTKNEKKKPKQKINNCPALEDWQSAPAPGNLLGKPARLRLQYPQGSALLLCWIVHHHDCF